MLETRKITDLPKITSFLLPKGYELLPNTSEVFELEFSFYEYKFLTKDETIKRGAFFKSIDDIPTYHYIICSNNSPLTWEGRSEVTKSYFKEGNFSTGYATHGLFPYRGKFHPQLIKGILNILRIQPRDVVLDPMCGSGTLNVEAAIIGIDSVGIEKSPFCVLMSKVKYEVLKALSEQLSEVKKEMDKKYKTLITGAIGGGTLEKEFSKQAKLINDGKIKNTKELIKSIRSLIPTDEQFKKAFEFATVSKTHIAHYYLRKLEESYRTTKELKPLENPEKVNLEHILPENPKNLKDDWPDFDENTHKTYYRRIGNLTLFDRKMNTDIGNRNFSSKREIYKKSEIVITKELYKFKNWTPKEIEVRQKDFAKKAIEIWGIN